MHRVNDLLQEVVTDVMRHIKDPAVEGALITITSVQVTPDLSQAKFYLTVMGKPVAEVVEGPACWQTQETTENHALIAATLSHLAEAGC